MNRAKIVAEIGCNHQGDIVKACVMIDKAARAGADIVKFQKRENRLLLTPEEYDAPHPVPENSFGDSYGAHREFLEFTAGSHFKLMEKCKEAGVEYSTSVWDRHSAWEMVQLKPKHLKIPSASNLDWDIYDELEKWDGILHISLGMTHRGEIDQIVERIIPCWERWSPVFYTCTSGYPVEPWDVYLKDIPDLKEELWDGFDVGFSGHHLGISLDIAAYALGAAYIERHFTFDKGAKGTDHSASLTDVELYNLRKELDTVCHALDRKFVLPSIEEEQRTKLKRKV